MKKLLISLFLVGVLVACAETPTNTADNTEQVTEITQGQETMTEESVQEEKVFDNFVLIKEEEKESDRDLYAIHTISHYHYVGSDKQEAEMFCEENLNKKDGVAHTINLYNSEIINDANMVGMCLYNNLPHRNGNVAERISIFL